MSKRYRVGVLGLTHDHIWHHVSDLAESPAIQLVAVADEHDDLIDQFRNAVATERVYSRAEDALEREAFDFVMIYADNRRSAELAIETMRKGVHVIVEKPMASTLQEAEAMLATASDAGVQLMVNWPPAWYPAFRHALTLAQEGRIGRVTHVDYRAAHSGPREYGCSRYFYEWLYDAKRNGGGVLTDYCCYGAMTTRVLLGVPHRVHATAGRYQKDYIQVEDNALLTMQYPRAMGTAQASWSQIGPGMGPGPVIYGTAGTILVHQRPGEREGHIVKEGQIELITLDAPGGRIVDPPALSVGERSAIEHFVTCLEQGVRLNDIVSADVGRDVQEILEAGYQSLAEGIDVSLPLRSTARAHRGVSDG